MTTKSSAPTRGGQSRRIVVIAASIAAIAGLATFLVVIEHGLASDLSATLARERVHTERVARLRNDARSAHIAILERWVTPIGERTMREEVIESLVARVRETNREFELLEPIDDEELGLTRNLGVAVAIWSNRVHQAVVAADGPSATRELRTLLDQIDGAVDALISHISAAGTRTDGRAGVLHRRQRSIAMMLVALAAASVGTAVVWWRATARAVARFGESERARLEGERVAAARARVFANMSHELRTPLVAIQAILAGLEGVTDERVAEATTSIRRESQELLGMINNVLDSAKLEAGHVQILMEDVSIGEVVRRCVARCTPLIGTKDVELVVDVADGLPPSRSDFVRLQQVFTNLIANAIKFTERGRVRIRAERSGSESIVVEVEDTGVGIAPEALEKIWTPFAQADGTVTRRFGGTGLGLSIVRMLMPLLGASIGVESSPGSGTRFSVTLPVAGGGLS